MGLIYQHIRIANAAKPQIEEVDARALVDSGAVDLCIPQLVATQLKLDTLEQREVTTADGRKQLVDYVGPIKLECFGRHAYTGAMVMGDVVLMGAIPMESMDLLIHPRSLQLIPNPENPTIPGAMAMGVRPASGRGSGVMMIDHRTVQIAVRDCDLSGSHFDDVNLAGSTFTNVNMTGLRISDANLSGMSIEDARLDGATIEGISVADLLTCWRSSHAG